MRRSAAVTVSVRAHLGQTVNMDQQCSRRDPDSATQPARAPQGCISKHARFARVTSNASCSMSPARTSLPPGRDEVREARRQRAQRRGQNIREQHIDGGRQHGRVAHTVTLLCNRHWRARCRPWRERLGIDVEAVGVAAPSLTAAIARMPEPQP